MAQDYTTLEEVKNSIEKVSDSDDALLTLLISTASRSIDRFCNRLDGFYADASTTERFFVGNGERWIYFDEAASISTVKMKESPDDDEYVTLQASDWIPFSGSWKMPNFNKTPYNGIIMKPNGDYDVFTSGKYFGWKGFEPEYQEGRYLPTVAITARWGYSLTVPSPIKQATIIMVGRWYKRSQSSWQTEIGNNEFGSMPYFDEVDNDVKFILNSGRYVKPSV